MTNELAYSYAGIIKSEKQDDGTIKVYGKATDDSIDIDQQICDEEWLKEAMPHWFKTGGNIREQHSSIAAGVATDYEHKADGHYIEAHIVDPVSVKKIEAGVLKGFSIGIRSPRVIRDAKASGGRIVGGQIVEVSVVDRPANSNAKMTIAKAVDGELVEVAQEFSERPTPASIANAMNKSVENPTSGETSTRIDLMSNIEIATKAAGLIAEIKKFDEKLFNNALTSIGGLISVEGKEAAEGHDERDSIKQLLKSLKHLIHFYRGEAKEGEVTNPILALLGDDEATVLPEAKPEEILLAAGGDKKNPFAKDGDKDEDDEKEDSDKEETKTADEKDKEDSAKSGDKEEAKDGSKGEPAKGDAGSKEPGQDDADDKDNKDEEMCAKCDKSADECKCADKSVLSDPETATIIEKAVKSARQAVEAELELLKSANVRLEAERDEALNKAASGGPVRAGSITKNSKHNVNELLSKATEYRAKAAGTEDRFLRTGYLELADDLETKARKG